ncbi:MAG TPA: monofunctional biosynthetic peptidoglycan transglycosylase [Dissulfurispiraceae bacterium]|nr:monofunctional biosynthetic peptidoglycan transglycosylase [Dissulfurispiraceae bacterium]
MSVKKLLRIVLLLCVLAFILSIGVYLVYPDVSKLKKENPKKTSFMEYREKQWKDEGREITIRQYWVPLSRISNYMTKAVLIAEDDKFWSHTGFDFEAIEKSFEKDLKEKKFKFGGSTISQQLAKNLYLSPSKNPLRKIKEAMLTWRIEKNLSKRRILELYLNVAEWGEGIFGIEAASRHYYGKTASALTAEEAAHLAAVLPNPKKYSPVASSRYVNNRSRIIYEIMVRRGIVVEEYEDSANDADDKNTNQEPPLIDKITAPGTQ